jgi:hypothetical protein
MVRQWALVLRHIGAALVVAVAEAIGMVVVEVVDEVADILSTTESRSVAAVARAMVGGIVIVIVIGTGTGTEILETEIVITRAISVTEISTDEQIDSTAEMTIDESNATIVTVRLTHGRKMVGLYPDQMPAFLAAREARRFHRRLPPTLLEANRQRVSTNRAWTNSARSLPLQREISVAILIDLMSRPRVLKHSGSRFSPRDHRLHPHLRFPLLDL